LIVCSVALLFGTGCASDVSKATVQAAVREASPACTSASFAAPDRGALKPPARLSCGAPAGAVSAYYFASKGDYEQQLPGLAQPEVLGPYVVAGEQWLATTDDRATADRLTAALGSSVVARPDFLRRG
jgi:hypothetical protein